MAAPEAGAAAAAPGAASPASADWLVKSVVPASTVTHVARGCFRGAAAGGGLEVVLGRQNVVELVAVEERAALHLDSLHIQPVFGTILDLRGFPASGLSARAAAAVGRGKDVLALLTDSGRLSFAYYEDSMQRCAALPARGLGRAFLGGGRERRPPPPRATGPSRRPPALPARPASRFVALTHVPLSLPGLDRRRLGRLLAVEPSGAAVAVAAFHDRIAVFPAARDGDDESSGSDDEEMEEASSSGGSGGGAFGAGRRRRAPHVVQPRGLLFAGEGLRSAGPAAPEAAAEAHDARHASGGTGWNATIWDLAFVGGGSGGGGGSSGGGGAPRPGPQLAALVHRAGEAFSEALLLQADLGRRTLGCLRCLRLGHDPTAPPGTGLPVFIACHPLSASSACRCCRLPAFFLPPPAPRAAAALLVRPRERRS